MERRKLFKSLFLLPLTVGPTDRDLLSTNFLENKKQSVSHRFKISLNAYSFNAPLSKKQITIEEVIEFCGNLNLDAIDLTGYYIQNYPAIPDDSYVYALKNKIHKAGLSVSGTGVRNDFGSPKAEVRMAEVEFVKKWIDVAAKLGAPVIRIFSAKIIPTGYAWDEVANWIIEAIKLCVAYGKSKGVIIGLQHHNDFILTAKQALYFVERLDKEWFGLIVDTGNFQTNEAYSEIKLVAPFAVNWQIKELITIEGKTIAMDLEKLIKIIADSPYKGYLPSETLNPGNPLEIIPPFLNKVAKQVAKYN